ncbi:MAG TPA: hypothetical protein PLC35_10490 [Methanosarcina vacuolata]|nr:hypothetical protein [Methanosarcina vacuolata]
MPISPNVTDFWRKYKQLVENQRATLGNDFIDLNYDPEEEKPAGSLSLYFRAFNIVGNLFDGPHIGYQTNAGEVVFYVPTNYYDESVEKKIEYSCKKLVQAGETCKINKTDADAKMLIIKIDPIQTIATKTFDANIAIAKLSYEKVVKLYRAAKKAFPGLPPCS